MKPGAFRETKSGLKIFLKPVEESDAPLVKNFLCTLSDESVRHRFLSLRKDMADDFLRSFIAINCNRETKILVLAEKNKKEELAGLGQFHVDSDASSAEVALLVGDSYQNRGIGRELFAYLVQLAKKKGLKRFEGIVKTDNRPMLHICKTMGFRLLEKTIKTGVYELKMYF